MYSVRSGVNVVAALSCLSVVGYFCLYNAVLSKSRINDNVVPLDERLCHWYKPLQNDTAAKSSTSSNVSSEDDFVPLLTLFSSWPVESNKHTVWRRTLENWAQLKPLVRPVFFSTSGHQADYVCRFGWDFLPVRKTASSNIPVLKVMFMDAICRFNSMFYGYANGDILFDDSLIVSLRTIKEAGLDLRTPVFITGIRTNVANLTVDETSIRNLFHVAQKKGHLFIPLSQDYFITDSSFPWADIPNVVIGRRGYDNWLLLYARQLNLITIDATETVLAVHQTTKAGIREGWRHRDSDYNVDLLRKRFKHVRYEAGATFCAQWRTVGNSTTNVAISFRSELKKSCFPLL